MGSPISIVWWRKIFTRYGQVAIGIMTLVLVIGFGWSSFGGSNSRDNNTQANADKVIMKVNGQPFTQHDFALLSQSARESPPGDQFAQAQGQILLMMVQNAVINQLAQQRKVHPSAAEIDHAIDTLRDQVGMKKSSDSDWEAFIESHTGMSLSEFREKQATESRMLIPALLQNYKATEQVSDTDVRNQNMQVKLDLILVSSGKSFMPQPGHKELSDADAKKKADALLAKIRSGADIAVIAKTDSDDPSAKDGGVLEFRPEYKTMGGMMDTFGALGFGKDFDNAVHATPIGKITDVIKASGFMHGYVFAKVIERKEDKPKNYDPKKAIDDLKSQRAQQKLSDAVEAAIKSAKVDIIDPDKKAFYDYTKLKQRGQEMQNAALMGKPLTDFSPAEYTKREHEVDGEFEAMLKRHPDDATAALLVAEAITLRKRYATGTTKAQQDQYRDQLIELYKTALKTTEDRAIRFRLADLYSDKKDYKDAGSEYQRIARYLGQDAPYTVQMMQADQRDYRTLASDFQKVDLPTDATKAQKAADALEPKIAAQKQKDAEAQQAAKNAAQQKTLPAVVTPKAAGAVKPSAGGVSKPTSGASTDSSSATPIPGTKVTGAPTNSVPAASPATKSSENIPTTSKAPTTTPGSNTPTPGGH